MNNNQKAQSKQGGGQDSVGAFSDYEADKIRSVAND